MKANIIRTKGYRADYARQELTRRTKKFIVTSILNSPLNTTRGAAVCALSCFGLNVNKKGSKTLLRNRCVISGRSNSINKQYNLSRIVMREYLQLGLIPGYKKAVW